MKTTLVPFLALALLPALSAQQHYHPAPGHLAGLYVSDSRAQLEAMTGSLVGRLLESKELKPLVDKAKAAHDAREKRVHELMDLLKASGGEMDLEDELNTAMRGVTPGSDIRNLRIWLWVSESDKEPTFVASLSAGAEEGKMLKSLWQVLNKTVRQDKIYAAAVDAPELSGQKIELLRCQESGHGLPRNVWYWNQGEQHVIGVGDQLLPGSFGKEPAPVAGGITRLMGKGQGLALNVAWDRVMALAGKEMNRAAMMALGLDGITALTFAMTVDGDHFRESLLAEMPKGPKGLLAAWTDAKAALPPHPQLPDGMLQIGMALDLTLFSAAIDAAEMAMKAEGKAGSPKVVRQLIPELQKALTGGLSFQVSAPARGSWVPRLTLVAGIADRAALDKLLEQARTALQGIDFDEHETAGVKWTSVKIPNSPSAMVPTFAILGDTFMLAESPATLKLLIKASQEGAATAMSTEGAPPVSPLGEPRPGLDVRYDVGTTWRALQVSYQSTVQLMINQQMGARGTPLLDAGELPEASVIAPHLGRGRGGLAVLENGIVLSTASSLGDPLLAALAAIVVPMMPALMGLQLDTLTGELQGKVGQARLKKIHQALATWRASFGGGKSLPKNLGDLFQRGLLDDEQSLLVPDAKETLKVEYEDAEGQIRKVSSSFRYVADGKLKVSKAKLAGFGAFSGQPFVFTPFDDEKEQKGEEVAIILYEHKEHPRGQRLLMTEDGKVHEIPEHAAADVLGGK